ncbi:MAG: hypothetical protein AAB049_03200, partial [Nitrospirota bacterium]
GVVLRLVQVEHEDRLEGAPIPGAGLLRSADDLANPSKVDWITLRSLINRMSPLTSGTVHKARA